MNMPMPDLTGSSAQNKKRPIEEIPDNIDEDDMKCKVNDILNKWQQGLSGKKNLLSLLTTLDEVWPCENLGIPSMQTLVNDKASVRTYYKKAMMSCHPDKNSNKNTRTEYIASCLYQILNEANTLYQS